MGQGYSLTTLSAGSAGIDVPELSHLSYEKSLGEARFMKTIRARHRHGLVIVKVAMKPYSSLNLRSYVKKIMNERKVLTEIPNALAYYNAFETANNGYLLRQYVYSSLYDRMSTRPFLEDIEKCWLAFQLLSAVRDCHASQVYHGDIKSENILVTSWNWLYLTDFSSAFKPTYLPEDNPAEFSFYFDISGRRTCYLAPERFLHTGEAHVTSNPLNWAMDIFSVGCVIAELFLETPIFTLSQLFNYKKGEYDPHTALLHRIENVEIRDMIAHMIQVEPESRYSADEYLNFWRGRAFPEYFSSFLHQYMALITNPNSGRDTITADESNLGESDDRIARVYYDYDKIAYFLGYTKSDLPDLGQLPILRDTAGPMQISLPRQRPTRKPEAPVPGEEGTFLFMNIITSSLRSTARSSARLQACDLLLAFSEHLPDEARLDRVLPFLVTLLDDSSEVVKIAALRSVTQLVSQVVSTSPVNAFVFPEYILPKLMEMFQARRGRARPGPMLRLAFAQCIASLAESGARLVDCIEALKSEGSLPSATSDAEDSLPIDPSRDFYDSARSDLVRFFETQAKQLLTDPDPGIRRTFLGSIASLCVFFGSAKTSDVILSHLNTYLNDRDWRLKCSFFNAIIGVAVYVGSNSLEEFILPLMILALPDTEETVVGSIVKALAVMASLGLFQRTTTINLIDLVCRYAMHPNERVRENAADFLASAVRYLSLADRHSIVMSFIGHLLRLPPTTFEELNFLDALKKPLSREVYDMTLKWASITENSSFWKHIQKLDASNRNDERFVAFSSRDLNSTAFAKTPKSEVDHQWIARLRDAGMSRDDEMKILILAEHVRRLSMKSSRSESKNEDATLDKQVKLSELRVSVNTFQLDTQEDAAEGGQRQVLEEDAGTDTRPQTISDALLDASATVDHDEHSMSLRPTDFATRSSPQDISIRRLEAIERRHDDTSPAQSSPLNPSPKERDHVVAGPYSASERSKRASRSSAMDLMQHQSIAVGKASPELGTSDMNAQGRVNSLPRGRDNGQGGERAGRGSVSTPTPNPKNLALGGYGGRDPNVLRLLESISTADHPSGPLDLGPAVVPISRRTLFQRNSGPNSERKWGITGVTIATFGEHTGPVNRVLVAPDHTFFVTASDDGSIKVWDAHRLERNVAHRSRQTYKHAPGVKVTALCFLDNTHSIVSAGSDGSIHLLRIDVIEIGQGAYRYNKIKLIRRWSIPDARSHAVWMEHLTKRMSSTLMIATNTGKVHALNINTMALDYTLQVPADHGAPTCFCIARDHQHWLLLGTSRGVIVLWDLRFHIRLRPLRFPAAKPITRMSLHPQSTNNEKAGFAADDSSIVYIAGGLGTSEVTAWNVEDFKCLSTWKMDGGKHSQASEVPPSKGQVSGASIADTKAYTLINVDKQDKSQTPRHESHQDKLLGEERADHSVRAFEIGTTEVAGSGDTPGDVDATVPYLFAAKPDVSLRMWNLKRGQTENSFVVAGLPRRDGMEATPKFRQTGSWNGIKVNEELLSETGKDAGSPQPSASDTKRQSAAEVGSSKASSSRGDGNDATKAPQPRLEQQSLLREHLDVVLDVAVIEKPYRMFISVDRSGAIFVFA